MNIEHFITSKGLEFVIVDQSRTYSVNREHHRLENIHDLNDVLTLGQRQFGRLPNGEIEILERYRADDDDKDVVLDSSPSWLAELASSHSGLSPEWPIHDRS